jgi:homoaconitate hydratase
MTTEWGGLSGMITKPIPTDVQKLTLAGLFPIDDMLISWYRAKATEAAVLDSPIQERINHKFIDELAENRLEADPDATYAKELYINLSTLSPFVAGPNSVKKATPLKELEPQNIQIDKAYLVSCTNSRASDIAAAALVVKQASAEGKPAKFAPTVKYYLAAASLAEQKLAEEAGDWQTLVDAGANVLPSGCGPCIGLVRDHVRHGAE